MTSNPQIEKELDETFSDRRLLVEAEAGHARTWVMGVKSRDFFTPKKFKYAKNMPIQHSKVVAKVDLDVKAMDPTSLGIERKKEEVSRMSSRPYENL